MASIRVVLDVQGNEIEFTRNINEPDVWAYNREPVWNLEPETIFDEIDIVVSSVKAAYMESIVVKRPVIEEHDE